MKVWQEILIGIVIFETLIITFSFKEIVNHNIIPDSVLVWLLLKSEYSCVDGEKALYCIRIGRQVDASKIENCIIRELSPEPPGSANVVNIHG